MSLSALLLLQAVCEVSLREQRAEVVEALELQRIAGRIEEKHGSLLAHFALKANVGFDHKHHARTLQPFRERLPLVHREHDAEVGDWHVVPVDWIAMLGLCCRFPAMFDVRDDLVPKQIEVDPLRSTPALRAAKNCPIKVPGGVQIIDWESDMKRRKLHDCLIS